MKKKRLNWRKIWRKFNSWYKEEEGVIGSAAWHFQHKKLAEIVEEVRNEKPQERKRKTGK